MEITAGEQSQREGAARPEKRTLFRVGFLTINSPLALVLRNLRARWVRTVLTTLGILVGVAAMVAVEATNNSTINAITTFFDEAAGQSDLLVEAAISGEGFDEGVLFEVQRLPGVTAVAPGVLGVTMPAEEMAGWSAQYNAGGTYVPGSSFWLLGRDPAADVGVHEYELVDGRLLEPGETAYNVLLVDEYAEEKGIELGEDFAIATPDSGVVALRVVGLIAKQGIGVTNEGVLGVAPLNVVQELFGQGGELSQIEIVVSSEQANDPDALEALRRQFESRLGDGVDVKYPASRGQMVADSLQSYQLGLNFFGVVSLFVGSFLIYNAFAMTVVERTREIGMLRTIGMTQRQVLSSVLLEAGLLGLFGSVVGVGFGLLLAQLLVVFVANFSGQTIERITATPESIVQAVVVGLVVTVLAALLPARQAAQVSPLQALRVQANQDEGSWRRIGLRYGPLTVLAAILVLYYVPFRAEVAFPIGTNAIFVLLLGATLCIPIVTGPFERVIRPFIVRIFGNEGRLGSSNVNRSQGRTTLTVAALMVGLSMVVGINGMTQSFEADMQVWIDSALGGDLFVRSPVQMRGDVEARLLGVEGVTAVTKSRYVSSHITTAAGESEETAFIAIDPATFLAVRSVRVQEGPQPAELIRQLGEGDAVWVGASAANKLGLSVGDEVLLETRRGERPFRVAAIVIDFAGGETITVTGSWNDLRRYFGVTDVDNFAARLDGTVPFAQVKQQIEEGVGRGQNLSVESKQEFEAKVRQLSEEAFGLFDVLGLIGLVVAALGVINTMLMNVLERTRELGGLRSLGMTRRQVQRMILAEAALIGLMGAFFGVAFGAVMADVFLVGLRTMGAFVLTPQTPYTAMAFSFVIALLLALGASLYPAYRAARVNIIEAVKHE